MEWPFVGRAELVEQIRQAIGSQAPQPLLVVGEPGLGRTAVVEQALTHLDRTRDVVIRPRPGGPEEPFGAVLSLLPKGFKVRTVCRSVIEEATAAILDQHVGDRRPVVVADDAHLVDLASMLVLRGLHRTAGALLLLTHPASATRGPGAVDSVRYEPGARTVVLGPLTKDEVGSALTTVLGGAVHAHLVAAVHAATGGHPGRLRELVQRGDLRGKVADVAGALRLAEPGRERVLIDAESRDRLLGAVRRAWAELDMGPLTELCKLAGWCGAAAQVAVIHGGALLFGGDPGGALKVLDGVQQAQDPARVVFLRALCHALGPGGPASAVGLLADTGQADPVLRERARAQLAWILAAAGDTGAAGPLLAPARPETDRETTVFRQAAVALVAREVGGGLAAIAPLRKALVLAEALRDELPWLPPYLRAQLIDVLLLGGRSTEATAMAAEFHASAPSTGWRTAVSLALSLPAARP